MSGSSFALSWFRRDSSVAGTLAAALSLSLGIGGLVLVESFSLRIGRTSERDARNYLAADFVVRSFKPIAPDVFAAATELADAWAEQRTLISSASLPGGEYVNISLVGLEGDFPFYGDWRTEPAGLRPAQNPGLYADPGLKAKGLRVGDKLKIGESELPILAFVLEEPSPPDFLATGGYKLFLPIKDAVATGLMSEGSRVNYRLLMKSSLRPVDFRRAFRERIPDPIWRLTSAEESNRQTQRLVALLRSFLSFVALTATFLGAVGVYMIFRARLRQKLPQYLTLRCLGLPSRPLIMAVFLQAALTALVGLIVGLGAGLLAESWLASLAVSGLGVQLAEGISWGRPLLVASVVAFFTLLPAMGLPLLDLLQVPVASILQSEDASPSSGSTMSPRTALVFGGLALGGIFLLSESAKWAAGFAVGLAGVLLLLALAGEGLIRLLRRWSGSARDPFRRYGLLFFVRRPARSRLLVASLGLGLFFVLSVMLIAGSLQARIVEARAQGFANLLVMGATSSDLESLPAQLPPGSEFVSYVQARLFGADGEILRSKDPRQGPDEVAEGEDPGDEVRVREYFVNLREGSSLLAGERLIEGDSLFGTPLEGSRLRVSVERDFAQRMELQLGKDVFLEIAGVRLPARVTSLRKVDWFSFRPNFFMVLAAEDVAGAPASYIGLVKAPVDDIASWQTKLSATHPHLTALDGRRIGEQVLSALGKFEWALLSLSGFMGLACLLVFVGMGAARRPELVQDVALLRCLGAGSSGIVRVFDTEALFAYASAALVALIAALANAFLVCEQLLEVPFRLPAPLPALGVLIVGGLAVWALNRALCAPALRSRPAELFRADA